MCATKINFDWSNSEIGQWPSQATVILYSGSGLKVFHSM